MKYRIKDKKKFERFIILSVIVFSVLSFLLISIFTNSYVEGKSQDQNKIIVAQGDTLWSIAESIDTERDIRELVYDIQAMNKVDTSILYPGTVLIIPSK